MFTKVSHFGVIVKDLEEALGTSWDERFRLLTTAMRHGLRPTTVARMAKYVAGRKLGNHNDLDRFATLRFLKLDLHLDIFEFLVREYRPYFAAFYLNQTDAFSHRSWRRLL